ncbi:hypothetical protein KR018_012412 [Drosophila ironensis]|nr:hypothetical protein KR018_012412 [Drosophila ironensis]
MRGQRSSSSSSSSSSSRKDIALEAESEAEGPQNRAMEMREVLSREGREAKNLLVYQFCDETSTDASQGGEGDAGGEGGASSGEAAGEGVGEGVGEGAAEAATPSGGVLLNGDCFRKPPMAPPKSPSGGGTPKNCQSPTSPRLKAANSGNVNGGTAGTGGPRVRSASTGRDKKSELQARYWALLFGNLQRAVNEIYQTVECYENISSCQEAILVLENYVRDFKALSEWFKVSWDYESRPLQQRPHSLAWEVRKSNPTPRVRTKSLCSPNNSGKSSPALFPGSQSGKTSPCCDAGQISPKKLLRAYDQVSRGAMRLNVRELFAAASSKRANQGSANQLDPQDGPLDLSGCGSECSHPNSKYSQTDLEDPHLTLADMREKMRLEAEEREAEEREAEEREAEEREAEQREAEDRETEEREAEQRETKERETEERDAEKRELEEREAEKRETDEREAKEREAEKREAEEREAKEREAKEREAKEREAKERKAKQRKTKQRETEEREAEERKAKEREAKERKAKEREAKERKAKEREAKEREAKERKTKQREAEQREAEQREAEERAALEKLEKFSQDDISYLLDEPPPKTTADEPKPPKVAETVTDQETQAAPTAVQITVATLESMENALLNEQAEKKPTPPSTVIKPVTELPKKPPPLSAVSGNQAQNSPLKYSSVLNKPVKKVLAPSAATKPSGSKPGQPKANPAPAAPVNGLRRVKVTPVLAISTAKPAKVAVQVPPPPRPSSKTECYGPPNNVASRLSARSRTMLEMSGNSGANNSTAPVTTSRALPKKTTALSSIANTTKKTTATPKLSSREDIASSTSTLKASNEQLAEPKISLKQEERHSEPKQLQLPTDANDGWLTVKNRRRSSMHWANRFNQPTGYASLPTLALLNEQQHNKEQVKKVTKQALPAKGVQKKPAAPAAKSKTATANARPEIKNAKAKVNSFPSLRSTAGGQLKKTEKGDKNTVAVLPSNNRSNSNIHPAPALRTSVIKRQKSDLTGLKMTSLHKEYMRSEKNALRKLQQKEQGHNPNQSNSSTSSSAETVVESIYDDHNKIDIKIQTNCEFSKTIGELYESISRNKLSGGPPSLGGKPTDASTLSACDENDEQSTEDNEERMLEEVQQSLERQIRELEQTEIDVDTETDETDCEVLAEEHDEQGDAGGDADGCVFVTVNDDENASLELRYQALFSGMSCNERVEVLATLEAYVARHPGRAQELHQKLSSPSRRRSLQETLKKYQAKQARAQEKRNTLQQEKAAKLQQLFARVEDVKAAQKQLIEDKRQKMQGRHQRAAENREQYLRQIIEKAHDEEKKLKEINFINNILAQNKRLDMLESSKETEGRLQDLEQERQKRVEEKLAKEAAVERRRQALEKERLLKLEKMNETRLEKEQRIGKRQEQKERERQALAREKARDREERMLALQVQQQQTAEELQRKILQKQMESARRHEENMEHIRQRALELTLPNRQADEGGRGDNEDGEPEEGMNGNASTTNEDGDLSSSLSEVGGISGHSRSYKKKMKKLKQRMNQCASEYLASLDPLPSFLKRDSTVPKLLNLVAKGGGAQGLDRTLGNLLRVIPKAQTFDFQAFLYMDGLGIITTHVIAKGMEDNSEVSKKSVHTAVRLYRTACSVCPQIARHALLGNSITVLFDAIAKSFQYPDEKSPQHPVELSTELMLACTEALSSSYVKKKTIPKVPERLPDMINYAVVTGLIEILSRRNQKVRESIELNQPVMLSLLTTMGFLTRFLDVCQPGPADATRLLATAKSTDLFGTLTMLKVTLVQMGDCLPPRTTALAASAFNVYVSLAALDVYNFQDTFTIEGPLSVKLLDVIGTIVAFAPNPDWVKNNDSSTLLIDLIATLAFFCVNNRRHQDFLITEPYLEIFKNLSKLCASFHPVLYPFLVAVSFNNAPVRSAISKAFDMSNVDEYSQSEVAQRNHFIKLINSRHMDKPNPSNKQPLIKGG